MKKYKLIKKLPFENSPEIGYISIGKYGHLDHYWNGNWFNPENYPEFWELVVEKDYEILSFSDNIGNIFNVKDNSEGILDRLGFKIHSVKRLSDGEIFTIGDTVRYHHNKKDISKKIIKFYIEQNILMITTTDSLGECSAALSQHEKTKQPLFTTEDGVDIFDGDLIYHINAFTLDEVSCDTYDANCGEFDLKDGLISSKDFNKLNKDDYELAILGFSTKEKAEEYILYNKPLLTLKDVEELLCKNTSSYFLEKFKKRAQKLNNKN